MGFFEEMVRKIRKLEEERGRNIWYTLGYIGSVSIVFLLPVVLGTYVGWWLDGKYKTGSISWTITFMLLGLCIGAYNVYRVVYRHEVDKRL